VAAPEVRWTHAGRYQIAYTIAGAGEIDVVFTPNWFSNCELVWEYPSYARFLNRLTSFSRLLVVDRRGTGLSDPLGLDEVPTIDERAEDVLAVLDAEGCDRVVLLGNGVGAYLPLYLAATVPERVSALVVTDGTACIRRRPDYDIGMPPHAEARLAERRQLHWGRDTDPFADRSDADNAFSAKYQRQSVARGRVETEIAFNSELDLRPLLAAIHVPTLVIHHRDNPQVRVTHGRYIADHVPGARFVELDGATFFWADDDRTMDAIEEFLTGTRRSTQSDAVLATLMYTDIVGSTERIATVGDRAWHNQLSHHETDVRSQLDVYGGREIKTMGDGFLAVFSSAQRAIACGRAVAAGAAAAGLAVRVGIHTGEIELRGDDIGGIAVNVANRVLGHAGGGEIVVSQTVKDLVLGAPIDFDDLGEHPLKGVPGRGACGGCANRPAASPPAGTT
jgi:class 3 adenylate cyclase